MTASQGGAAPDSRSEYVISITERPSRLRMTSPAPYPHTTPVIPPPPPPPPQLPRVPAVAARGVAHRRDINQQLVERVEELYRQLNQSPDNVAATAAV